MDASAPNSQGGRAEGERARGSTNAESKQAAILIQKTFRGHRTRRQLKGFGLDASTRWYEAWKAVKDAKFQDVTTPRPPQSPPPSAEQNHPTSPARERWKMVTEIARRAGADDASPSMSDCSSTEDDGPSDLAQVKTSPSREEREQAAKKRAEATARRKRTAKMMDLQYFLEMVDQKHRYGSNLRKYHNYWKSQDTDQNFFYWLDQGDGKDAEVPECSRTRLDEEQVRYLSREERQQYLVRINEEGLFVWAKNGERVWTKDALYKDSVQGIVPATDPTPSFKYNVPPPGAEESDSSSSSSSEDEDEKMDNTAGDEGERYVNEDFHRARGISKIKHVSPAVLFNHMIRTSLKKGQKWIFVADTSCRLFIGYKQSGAFQHSSFLHGARILAAGIIKIKDGQLRRLSPLSGHYRPPAANFRTFVHSLREAGADMSHVSISRSYAVLVGLESYVHTRRRVKTAEKMVIREKDKVLHPEKIKEEEEANRDKSQSAEKERLWLAQQREAAEREACRKQEASRRRSGSEKFSRLLSRIKSGKTSASAELSSSNNKGLTGGHGGERRVPGTGPEDGIPPPEGER
ncbi:uncharacterized protein A1O9_04765 [Exophiala aquamarina CBS 119918]|uniref:IQ domain-containing protein IQM6 n=1 Tax=Exophiala aquamarina CBS 119918 TaxID=1182545 RepID=A0A072PJJ4_9EURO|nr:uncharacterized protein A1O9_04765 [Exophiala aquamarina CBS 119918]KEF59917.1 hypothetical protein A1O9_04765 [Exophiala aquamarina CBS 119918]